MASERPNNQAHLPGRLQRLGVARNQDGDPVRCNGLIIFMASVGMGGAPVPRVYGLEAAKLLPSVGFSGRTHLPTTMRAQAPAPMPKEYHDAFLQPTAPILLRRRFACQDD